MSGVTLGAAVIDAVLDAVVWASSECAAVTVDKDDAQDLWREWSGDEDAVLPLDRNPDGSFATVFGIPLFIEEEDPTRPLRSITMGTAP